MHDTMHGNWFFNRELTVQEIDETFGRLYREVFSPIADVSTIRATMFSTSDQND
jgi:hypothetical protein